MGRPYRVRGQGLLDRADLHDGVGPGEDLDRLEEARLVVGRDQVEARELLGGLGERSVGDQGRAVRAPPDGVRAPGARRARLLR